MTIDIDELERLRLLVARTAQYDNMERYHAALEAAAPELIAAYRELHGDNKRGDLHARLTNLTDEMLGYAPTMPISALVTRLEDAKPQIKAALDCADEERDTLRAEVERLRALLRDAGPVLADCAAHAAYVIGGDAAVASIRAAYGECKECVSAADHENHARAILLRIKDERDAIERGEHLKGGG